jgi:hypothetical protein
MKITIELSESDLKEICRVTGERKKGPAIGKLVAEALLTKRRAALAKKFISGKWGVELKGLEATQAADELNDVAAAKRWRGARVGKV